MQGQIIQGDCLSVLQTLPSNYVQTCVTSPPYFGLRDYGCEDQIGLEESPEEYVQKLTAVFREIRRVLRPDGTLWLNLGDSYHVGNGEIKRDKQRLDQLGEKLGTGGGHKISDNLGGEVIHRNIDLKPKNLLGIPWRVAFSLQADGWILRSDIIWHKTNAMPESVQDRPTKAHEYVFLLAKSERYFYDADAIRETPTGNDKRPDRLINGISSTETYFDAIHNGRGSHTRMGLHPPGRNKRSVWSIATIPYKDAHFAVMAPELARLCILAGSSPGDIVLDPFSGAATTAYVASKLGRSYIGIELNPEYVELSHKRLSGLSAGLWGFDEEIA